MYPSLNHLIYDLFGINISFLKIIATFGFFVALAFIIGGLLISKEIKRKEEEGLIPPFKRKEKIGEGITTYEILSSIIGGFIIGFKLFHAFFNYPDLIDDPHQFILSLEGNLMGGIVIASISLYSKYKEKEKIKLTKPKWIEKTILPHELVSNMIMIAAVSGIFGAALFAKIENWNDERYFIGLNFYGGLVIGAIAVIYYARKNGIKLLHLTDTFAPALILSYGVGRMGCHFSGDGDWGIKNTASKPEWMSFLPDWMWSYNYPHNVNSTIGSVDEKIMKEIEGCEGTFWDPYCYELAYPVYPTPIYEIIMAGIIFIFLWSIRKKITIPGVLFFVYLILNGIERFLIEIIRVNSEDENIIGEISQAQIISLCLIFIGIIGIIILNKNIKKNRINL